MKVFAFLVFLFVWIAGPLEARAGLCITGTHTYDSTTQRYVPQGPPDQLGAQFYQASGPQFYYSSAPRCESIQTLKNVSMVLGVSLQIGAITALCTGAGLPVTIALEVGSAALLVADGILDNIIA